MPCNDPSIQVTHPILLVIPIRFGDGRGHIPRARGLGEIDPLLLL
jgi:hypothetical protein